MLLEIVIYLLVSQIWFRGFRSVLLPTLIVFSLQAQWIYGRTSKYSRFLLLLILATSPGGGFPSYEVVNFQPQTLITPDLVSVAYCYLHLLDPPHPPILISDIPSPQTHSPFLPPYRIILLPGRHPSPSQNTSKNPSPSLPSPVTTRSRLFFSSLDLTTPDIFPSPLLQRCF